MSAVLEEVFSVSNGEVSMLNSVYMLFPEL
jgi:hypothetical protein